jgi:hypothetical protein
MYGFFHQGQGFGSALLVVFSATLFELVNAIAEVLDAVFHMVRIGRFLEQFGEKVPGVGRERGQRGQIVLFKLGPKILNIFFHFVDQGCSFHNVFFLAGGVPIEMERLYLLLYIEL